MKNNGTLEKQNDADKADKKNKTGFNTVHNIPFIRWSRRVVSGVSGDVLIF